MKRICLLRLSAIGDVTHAVATVKALQAQAPGIEITWIIGRLEYKLLQGLAGVEFIVFDKSTGVQAYRDLKKALGGRRFDALLHMQVAFRANLASAVISAPLRVGYDPARSKDLHGLFINRRIEAATGQHVLSAMMSFLTPLGFEPQAPQWDFALADADHEFAEENLPKGAPILAISAVSSHKLRNWRAPWYAEVADHAAAQHGMQVVITGGPSPFEASFNQQIESHMKSPALNLTGKDTLKQLAAMLGRCTMLLAPDTGPMHMANAMGTPVLGLHAASNPARSGPFDSLRWCADSYDAAAQEYLGKQACRLKWGTKIERPGVMDLVTVGQVKEKLDAFVAAGMPRARQDS